MEMPGNRLNSKAVPGADQAVMIGSLSHQLSSKPLTPAPIEIAQIHEVSSTPGTWPAWAAWMKMSSGPAYEISTASNPATQAVREPCLNATQCPLCKFVKDKKALSMQCQCLCT
ncbi:hypothetical protein GCM10010975_25680 [Comamonas phosphati]|nr:hypothetical protein GCM10010975_25680 [Comamonas phosphati]